MYNSFNVSYILYFVGISKTCLDNKLTTGAIARAMSADTASSLMPITSNMVLPLATSVKAVNVQTSFLQKTNGANILSTRSLAMISVPLINSPASVGMIVPSSYQPIRKVREGNR